MRFGMVGRMGQRMRQVVGFWDRSTGGSNFRGEYGAPHCNQWGVCGVASGVPLFKSLWDFLFVIAAHISGMMNDISVKLTQRGADVPGELVGD